MGLRNQLRALRRAARGNMLSFELEDGSTFYFDPQDGFKTTFGYFSESLTADYRRKPRPEPPEALLAVANAKDRRYALEMVMGGSSFLPVKEEALVERGEFVPRSMIAGREYDEVLEEVVEEGAQDAPE